jgi:predicted GNAT family N-acyltransferase
MKIKIIEFNSKEYEQLVGLRVTQLLEPIGIPASYINRQGEQYDIFIGAFENGEIIGCCVLTPKNESTLQLRQMAVRIDYRGKRVGAAIIEYAEAITREKNFSVLMMHARDPVIDFYKKCGYEIVGEQFFEVGMGHHKMQKRLSGPPT